MTLKEVVNVARRELRDEKGVVIFYKAEGEWKAFFVILV